MSNVNAQGTSQSLVQGQRRDITMVEQRGSSVQSSHHGNPSDGFVNLSQAYDAGYSIPTAMFNTAAFGDVNMATAAATRESTGQTLPHPPGTKQTPYLNNPSDTYSSTNDSLDDDLILPDDFDDNFELDLRTEEVAPPAAPSRPTVSVQQNAAPNSEVLNENQILKERIAEVQRNATCFALIFLGSFNKFFLSHHEQRCNVDGSETYRERTKDPHQRQNPPRQGRASKRQVWRGSDTQSESEFCHLGAQLVTGKESNI